MTLKAIKAMFAVGQRWQVRRICPGYTIHGNLGDTVVPPSDVTEKRVILKVASTGLVAQQPSGGYAVTNWPKAPEVIEALPNYLHLKYEDGGVEVLLTLIA